MARCPRSPLAALLLLLTACDKGPPPQNVRVELPEMITTLDPFLLPVRVRDATGRSETAKPPFDVTITPESVADIAEDGTLSCVQTGDAKIAVNVRGVVGTDVLHCRLVSSIEVPPLERLDVSKGAFQLKVHARSKDGTELTDVPITVTPSKGNPVRINGLEITPVQVGNTSLTIRAGSESETVPVKVVRSLKLEALPMNDGKRINFSLPEGKYLLRVTVKSGKPVGVEWRGAPYCNYQGGPKTVHESECTLQGKGGVVFDNPRFLDSGITEANHDGVELYEVP